jgi:DNA primase
MNGDLPLLPETEDGPRTSGFGRYVSAWAKGPFIAPELLAAAPSVSVFVCEGEKDANAVTRLGLVATTNPGGAGKWRIEYNEPLHGRVVVLLPDNDKAGREHAEDVTRSLQGIAATVKVVALPGLLEKGDVSDWLTAGGTRETLERLIADGQSKATGRSASAASRPRANSAMIEASSILRVPT